NLHRQRRKEMFRQVQRQASSSSQQYSTFTRSRSDEQLRNSYFLNICQFTYLKQSSPALSTACLFRPFRDRVLRSARKRNGFQSFSNPWYSLRFLLEDVGDRPRPCWEVSRRRLHTNASARF